jgi:hypothetical protein
LTYNPNLDLVFGIFLILVPFIMMGALGIAAVILSKKEGTPSVGVKTACDTKEINPSIPAHGTVEAPPSPETPAPADTEMLELASHLEHLLRMRLNGTPDSQLPDGSHDLKLIQELTSWEESERGLQHPQSHRE